MTSMCARLVKTAVCRWPSGCRRAPGMSMRPYDLRPPLLNHWREYDIDAWTTY
jgi:hypothetical protein